MDAAPHRRRVVAVLPDVSGIDRTFAYTVPAELDASAVVGAIVRVPLHGRRVRGWIVGEHEPGDEADLRELLAVASRGPDAAVVDLCRFCAWRYAGRLRPFLVAASPPRAVRALPTPLADEGGDLAGDETVAALVRQALSLESAVLRLPPAAPRLDVVVAVRAAIKGGSILVLVPDEDDIAVLGRRLAARRQAAVRLPEGWPQAAAGAPMVVGNRSAVFASIADLAAIVVLDAHAEAYAEQRAPTWDATEIGRERALRARIPCVVVSPTPTLVQLAHGELVTLPPETERDGWAHLAVIDRRNDDPRAGLFSSALVDFIRGARRERPDRPVVCVLNRTGKARLLACGRCRELVRCEHCGAALVEGAHAEPESALHCPVCRATRPAVCANCGSARLSRLRLGTARAAEELGALVGEPAAEVSATSMSGAEDTASILVGTEAVLHRRRSAALVAFLDFDQELFAPRFRAGEEALVLLARASRLVGRRADSGRVVVQTRSPGHEVLAAVGAGDPGRFALIEAGRRDGLGLPPARALAEVSGQAAPDFVAELSRLGLEVGDIGGGRVLVRAADAASLADALAAAGAPKPGVRVAVDPVRA